MIYVNCSRVLFLKRKIQTHCLNTGDHRVVLSTSSFVSLPVHLNAILKIVSS